jgi:hypothetical protein
MADQDSSYYQDPGWIPAVRGYFRVARVSDGLVALRAVFLNLTVAALLVLFVLTFVIEDTGDPSPALLALIVVLGATGAIAARFISQRRLDPQSETGSAHSYRTHFFLAFAINEASLLLAFVLCFIEQGTWPYLVELPIFLIGMAAIAPGKHNLERIERGLMSRGGSSRCAPSWRGSRA